MGLNFPDAMFVLLVSGVIGSALPAAMGILGPLTRLSQMEAGRFFTGPRRQEASRIPELGRLHRLGCGGDILSASALVTMLAGFGLAVPFWLALAFLVIVQLVIGVYGHHLIQETSRYTGIILGLMFVVVGIVAMHKAGAVSVPDKPDSLKDVFFGPCSSYRL